MCRHYDWLSCLIAKVWAKRSKSVNVALAHRSSSPAGALALVQGEGKALGARWSPPHSEG